LPLLPFKVGDHVERTGSFVPDYLRSGVITRIIPGQERHRTFESFLGRIEEPLFRRLFLLQFFDLTETRASNRESRPKME
jgi:hypothetical protein